MGFAMVVRPLMLLLLLAPLACGDDGGTNAGGTDEGTSTTTGDGSSTTDTTQPNQPPPTPTLVSPLDAAQDVGMVTEESVTAELCWDLVEDPDGDPVRYRVWLDDIELTEGKLETEPGWAGPCLGPLSFNYAQSYAWRVTAFDPTTEILDDAGNRTGWGSESEPSDTFSFTTIRNEASEVLFEDDFEEDRGWTVAGDANGGHWELGDPTPAEFEGAVSSPDQCAGQDGCYFTGINMEGYPNIADVRGGTTELTSPPIDHERGRDDHRPGLAVLLQVGVPRDRHPVPGRDRDPGSRCAFGRAVLRARGARVRGRCLGRQHVDPGGVLGLRRADASRKRGCD